MAYSLPVVLFFACGFLSAWLSFSIAYLMFKSWRLVRLDYLLGFPVGFSLLALAFVIGDMAYAFPLASIWNWVSLLLGSWGFAFLVVTYFLRYGLAETDESRSTELAFGVVGVSTFASFGFILLLSSALPDYLAAESVFRVVDLVLLGYIILSLNRALKAEVELSAVVLGFTFLAIEQSSLFLHALDRAFVWSVIFAQLVRIAGLFILTVFLVRGFQSPERKGT
jgi:hypothetical protein